MRTGQTTLSALAVAAGACLAGCMGGGPGDPGGGWDTTGVKAPDVKAVDKAAFQQGPVHQHTARTIDGQTLSLDEYRGRPLLIVNVASECGYTPQYEQLEALYRSRRTDGLVVLGFPSNDFNGQEPLDNQGIQSFCIDTYDVTFPLFAKGAVIGQEASPLFAELSQATAPPSWNFTKYLVDANGQVVARFEPKVSPLAPEVTAKIDELLKASAPQAVAEQSS